MLRSIHPTIGAELPPTMTVEDAARLLGISRSTAYTETARYRQTDGEAGIPCAVFGSRVVVLTVPLLKLLRSLDAFRVVPAGAEADTAGAA